MIGRFVEHVPVQRSFTPGICCRPANASESPILEARRFKTREKDSEKLDKQDVRQGHESNRTVFAGDGSLGKESRRVIPNLS